MMRSSRNVWASCLGAAAFLYSCNREAAIETGNEDPQPETKTIAADASRVAVLDEIILHGVFSLDVQWRRSPTEIFSDVAEGVPEDGLHDLIRIEREYWIDMDELRELPFTQCDIVESDAMTAKIFVDLSGKARIVYESKDGTLGVRVAKRSPGESAEVYAVRGSDPGELDQLPANVPLGDPPSLKVMFSDFIDVHGSKASTMRVAPNVSGSCKVIVRELENGSFVVLPGMPAVVDS